MWDPQILISLMRRKKKLEDSGVKKAKKYFKWFNNPENSTVNRP
jgi:hypothetical protein